MSDADRLLHDLAEVRSACVSEDWGTAVALMRAHDHHVRAALATTPLEAMQGVLLAQRALLQDMVVWKEVAARRLEESRRATQAVHAYREGREP